MGRGQRERHAFCRQCRGLGGASLVTTAQAEDAGVSRKQLARMASSGAIERVAQGVYRMAGAPPQDHEAIYTTWLALGGASAPRTETGWRR